MQKIAHLLGGRCELRLVWSVQTDLAHETRDTLVPPASRNYQKRTCISVVRSSPTKYNLGNMGLCMGNMGWWQKKCLDLYQNLSGQTADYGTRLIPQSYEPIRSAAPGRAGDGQIASDTTSVINGCRSRMCAVPVCYVSSAQEETTNDKSRHVAAASREGAAD